MLTEESVRAHIRHLSEAAEKISGSREPARPLSVALTSGLNAARMEDAETLLSFRNPKSSPVEGVALCINDGRRMAQIVVLDSVIPVTLITRDIPDQVKRDLIESTKLEIRNTAPWYSLVYSVIGRVFTYVESRRKLKFLTLALFLTMVIAGLCISFVDYWFRQQRLTSLGDEIRTGRNVYDAARREADAAMARLLAEARRAGEKGELAEEERLLAFYNSHIRARKDLVDFWKSPEVEDHLDRSRLRWYYPTSVAKHIVRLLVMLALWALAFRIFGYLYPQAVILIGDGKQRHAELRALRGYVYAAVPLSGLVWLAVRLLGGLVAS